MKKALSVFAVILTGAALFAVSYVNNTYQKLANEYARKAQSALNAGEYELSEQYALKAEENAALSKAYIALMMERKSAEDNIKLAKNQVAYAEKINAPNTFPMAYSAAIENLTNAESSFESEDYPQATEYAKACIASLDGIREVTPLPEYYIVKPWAETKDCYWNISGRPYIYNNPLLWENLYQANKNEMPKPEDPNLILPGMKMKIPSITGEYRSGVYDSKKSYDAYGE